MTNLYVNNFCHITIIYIYNIELKRMYRKPMYIGSKGELLETCQSHQTIITSSRSHRPTGFFLFVSLFVIAMSILAVYSTIAASEYGLKRDDMHTHAIVHLVKSNDWLNDYEEQRLEEKILESQIDNVNITLQNNNSGTSYTATQKQANDYLHKYQSYIDTLHTDKSVEGSLANSKV